MALSSRSAPDTLNDAAESWRLVTATTVSTVPLVSVARSKKKFPVRLLPAIVAVAPIRLTRTNGPAGRLKLWGAPAPPGNVWLIAADVVLTSTVTAEVTVRIPAEGDRCCRAQASGDALCGDDQPAVGAADRDAVGPAAQSQRPLVEPERDDSVAARVPGLDEEDVGGDGLPEHGQRGRGGVAADVDADVRAGGED